MRGTEARGDVMNNSYVGKLVSITIGEIEYAAPVVLGYEDLATGTFSGLTCYPDRLMLNGESATDAQVVAFLKAFAARQIALREAGAVQKEAAL